MVSGRGASSLPYKIEILGGLPLLSSADFFGPKTLKNCALRMENAVLGETGLILSADFCCG